MDFSLADMIICYATIYSSFEDTIQYITETSPAEVEKVHYIHSVSDKHICEAFEETRSSLRGGGELPRIAVFEIISSERGIRMSFECLTEQCRSYKILSCIDIPHSIGQLLIDMHRLDPDFS